MKFALVLILTFAVACFGLDCNDYKKAYLVVDSLISKNYKLIPDLVRLAFHDCVGESCNGCLDPQDPLNAGLGYCTKILESTYRKYIRTMMSRADFWSLASEVALIRGALNVRHPLPHLTLRLQYLWGRHDCTNSPISHGPVGYPTAHGDYGEVLRVLRSMFQLSHREIVALMGAHSLGGALRNESGFAYTWDSTPYAFDNNYYLNLINLPYTHVNVAHSKPRRIEFVAQQHRYSDEDDVYMMLNTDMCLYKNIRSIVDDDKYTGRVVCEDDGDKGYVKVPLGATNFVQSKCEDASTAKYVEMYAQDIQKFYDDFTVAWYKMVSHGYESQDAGYRLQPPSDDRVYRQ
eukprot:TRINITY_DN250_c0_g1_i3.p1 TRINITY_DN250_c0_g1~~TRINITY_DN250_c0_g1_i3.p1  ORF type:complete len:347 (-),score=52.61 TRINITY_DN250_c0_g1_i3:230-1270(-)